MTAGQWLRKYTSIFQQAGIEEAVDEARVLLRHALKLSKAQLFAQPERIMSADELALLEGLAERRLKREPAAYIVQHKEFYGLDLFVDPRVLIPRPETELLVEPVMAVSKCQGVKVSRMLDLCTGSGSIAISLTKSIPECKIVASDISQAALSVARLNAKKNGVYDNIEFVQSDLFNNITGKFDIIASNPPYIAGYEFESLQKEVLMEPHIALDGGKDGLDFYRRIISEAARYLDRGGYLIIEIGFGQKEAISKIIKDYGELKLLEVKKDFSGIDRVIVAQWIN